MSAKPSSESVQLSLPMQLGARFVEELRNHPVDEVRQLADNPEAEKVFEAVQYVMSTDPISGFLHSALCAMSLPVRRPTDEFAPIIRRDGNYTLIIRPVERMKMVDGDLVSNKVGVPFGVLARLVMLFIMSQAVKQRSREIYLGDSFAAWMRRMGFENTDGGGPRGSRALIQDQIERLMACEWTIRWDQEVGGSPSSNGKAAKKVAKSGKTTSISAFAVNDMRLVNQYGGISTSEGEFVSRFVLSEAFYQNLILHSVPLNERAFAALKRSATQIDLYTYLAYRLPRITKGEEVRLSWQDLAAHLGNDTSAMFKFRQTVRKAWVTVSGVYQQAREAVSFDDLVVRLRHADAPIDNHMVRRSNGVLDIVSIRPDGEGIDGKEGGDRAACSVSFPKVGSIRWHAQLRDIAQRHGSNNDIDLIADRFRKTVGEDLEALVGDRLLLRFQRFCETMQPPR